MNILFSILVRIIISIPIAFYAFWIGVGLGMGFDSGVNFPAVLLSSAYLLTVIPIFFILFFVPARIIFKPPLILKMWYGWLGVVVITSVFATGYVIDKTRSRFSTFTPGKATVVCVTREVSGLAKNNEGFVKLYRKRSGMTSPLKPGQKHCTHYGESIKNLEVRVNFTEDPHSKLNVQELLSKTPEMLILTPGTEINLYISKNEDTDTWEISRRTANTYQAPVSQGQKSP